MLLKIVVALSAASLSAAQALSSLPDLSTATLTTASTTSAAASTTSAAASSTAASTTATSATSTASFPALSSGTSATATAVSTVTSGSSVFTISSGYPTIAGAGIPTMIVPNTAGAPFMQQQTMPEGTVFIAVGAVLAFLGACVLLWRGAVAWKNIKELGGAGSGYNPAFKGATYHDLGSSVSMEALTPTGKQMKTHFKDIDSGRSTPPPAANLFFSPTAQGRNVNSIYSEGNRNSSYLPAGYYAQPSSQVAGGNRNTVIGGTVPPFARNSAYEPSPPGSPALRPTNGSLHPRVSHDNLRAPPSRDGVRNTVYSQMSNSSLAANLGARPGSAANFGGSRAPSAYLEEMFENHTAMASRDRL
ncbi:hypothetical protein AMS68_005629 [Peltaster fructicola]|uniref:Mid2 domain-containing protein n=1 Tax=Peltaster fructicola TaxID=286661 RepID=A0A6H0XZB1_9PEZI|nr:hypothetical protein AMS68_005629 [Peltaster fructicola]